MADAETAPSLSASDGSLSEVDARLVLPDASGHDAALADAGTSDGAAAERPSDAGGSISVDAAVVLVDSDDFSDAGQAHGDELRHL